jgi:hypothetical protein
MAFGILTGKSHGLHVAEDESHGDPSSAENTSGMGNRHVRSTSWRLVARSATAAAAAAAEAEAHAGGAVGGKETDGKEGDATKTDGAPKSPLSISAPPPATPKATAEAKTPQGKKRLAHEKEYDEQAEALFDALVEAKGAGGGSADAAEVAKAKVDEADKAAAANPSDKGLAGTAASAKATAAAAKANQTIHYQTVIDALLQTGLSPAVLQLIWSMGLDNDDDDGDGNGNDGETKFSGTDSNGGDGIRATKVPSTASTASTASSTADDHSHLVTREQFRQVMRLTSAAEAIEFEAHQAMRKGQTPEPVSAATLAGKVSEGKLKVPKFRGGVQLPYSMFDILVRDHLMPVMPRLQERTNCDHRIRRVGYILSCACCRGSGRATTTGAGTGSKVASEGGDGGTSIGTERIERTYRGSKDVVSRLWAKTHRIKAHDTDSGRSVPKSINMLHFLHIADLLERTTVPGRSVQASEGASFYRRCMYGGAVRGLRGLMCDERFMMFIHLSIVASFILFSINTFEIDVALVSYLSASNADGKVKIGKEG